MEEDRMKPKAVFGIISRSIGLILIIYEIHALVLAVFGPLWAGFRVFITLACSVAIGLAIGVYLLMGAPHLMDFSYPGKSGSDADS